MKNNDANNIWKEKAIKKSAEIKALKKRIKELTFSRNSWKEKYKTNKVKTVCYYSPTSLRP